MKKTHNEHVPNIKGIKIKSLVPDLDDVFKENDKYDNEAARIIHDHIAMGGDYEDFDGKTMKQIANRE